MSGKNLAFTENEADEIYMQRHLQLILPTFAHAFQIAIIKPLVKQFREKAARSDTIFDLIKYHKEMVAKLETAVFFEETPVIGKKVLTILKIAKGELTSLFERLILSPPLKKAKPLLKRKDPRGIIWNKSKLTKCVQTSSETTTKDRLRRTLSKPARI